MRKPPVGWPRISSSVFYKDAAAAIDWLCKAFGFEVQLKVEDEAGLVVHSELIFGGGLVMVGDTRSRSDDPNRAAFRSPADVGGACTQAMFTYVDDVDAHCDRARAAGAKIFKEPLTTDYGADYWADRSYGAVDPEGHHWWFATRVRDKE
jgi:uncharacterized glyoxalase superfamily protein PhnB